MFKKYLIFLINPNYCFYYALRSNHYKAFWEIHKSWWKSNPGRNCLKSLVVSVGLSEFCSDKLNRYSFSSKEGGITVYRYYIKVPFSCYEIRATCSVDVILKIHLFSACRRFSMVSFVRNVCSIGIACIIYGQEIRKWSARALTKQSIISLHQVTSVSTSFSGHHPHPVAF